MSDIRNLTVGLSLNTDNFSTKMKAVNQQLKTLKSNYKSASADSKGFDSSFTGLTNRISNITSQIDIYKTKLELITKRLEEAREKNDSLKRTMDEAESVYKSNQDALNKLAEEGKQGTDEFEALRIEVEASKKAFDTSQKAYLNSASSLEKFERESNELKSTLSLLDKELVDCNDKLKNIGNQTESTESKLEKLSSEVALSESKFTLLRSELSKNASEVQKLGIRKQELIAKQEQLSQKTNIFKESLEKVSDKLQKHENSLKEVRSAIDVVNTEIAESTAKFGENSKEVESLKAKLLSLKDKEIELKNSIAGTNTELNKAQKELNETQAELNETNRELNGIGWEKASASVDKFSNKLKAIGSGLQTVGRGMSLYVTAPVIGFGTAAVKTSVDFETAMSNVQAISNSTGEDLEKLTEKARELGASTSLSASDAASGLGYMALAGWNTTQMLEGLEPILRLAEASGMELGLASDLVTDSLSSMKLEVKDLAGYLDVVTKASTTSNTSIQQLMEAFLETGAVASQLNIPTESLASALGVLANNGTKGSQAGRAMSSILSRLSKPTKEMRVAMNQLGIELFDTDGKFRGLEVVLGDLNKSFSKLTEEEKVSMATILAGKNYLANFLQLVDSGSGTMQDYTKSLKNADGALMDVAKTMKDNLQGKMENLSSAWEELMIVFGNELAPVVTEVVKGLTNLAVKFSKLDDNVKKSIVKWGAFLAILGPIIATIGSLVKTIGTVAAPLGKMFKAVADGGGVVKTMTASFGKAGASLTKFGGVVKGIAPFLTNPWVLASAAVIGTTAVIINETKKQKQNIEKMTKDNKEAVHGLEARYESLSKGVESSIEKIRKSNEKWMTPQAKANLVQDMKDIQKIIEGGGGNATKEISELVKNVKGVWENLTPEMKTETTEALTAMLETFVRDGSMTVEEAKKLVADIQKELDVELHLNTEQLANDLKLEGIYNRISEGIQEGAGYFGVENIFGDIQDIARNLVRDITKELEGVDNIDVTKMFKNIIDNLTSVGASSKQQSEIIKNTLKPALIETFGGEGAAQYISNYVDSFYSASEAPQALIEAMQLVNQEYAYLTLDQQLALDEMNAQLIEKLGVQSEIMSGSVQDMLSQNSECWAGMVANQLLASENMKEDLTTFTAGAVAQITNMSDNLQGQMEAAEWFNTFINRLYETGSISSEQAKKMAEDINGALNKEVLTTSKLDSSQFDTSIKTSLGKISELTSQIANPSSLLDDKKFTETETSLKKKIEELNKAKAKPEIIAEAEKALSDIKLLKERIDALKDKTVTIREKRITEVQTVYSKSPSYATGNNGNGTGRIAPIPQTVNDLVAVASDLTDNVSSIYQTSGGYYNRSTSNTLVKDNSMERAIVNAIREMANKKGDINQTVNITTRDSLSPREIARQNRLAMQKLIRAY